MERGLPPAAQAPQPACGVLAPLEHFDECRTHHDALDMPPQTLDLIRLTDP